MRHRHPLPGLLVATVVVGCTGHVGTRSEPPTNAPSKSAEGPTAQVTVRLLASAMPGVTPLPGDVTLRGQQTYTVAVPASGVATVTVLPGSYVITGRSPKYDNNTGVCRHDGEVSVSAGSVSEADVLCVEK